MCSYIFKRRLRKACEKQIKCNGDQVRIFFANNKVPTSLIGVRDRSYGFFFMTTILRCFGKEEGVNLLKRLYPGDRDIATACYTVFGIELKYVDKEAYMQILCRDINRTCNSAAAAISATRAITEDDKKATALEELELKLKLLAAENWP